MSKLMEKLKSNRKPYRMGDLFELNYGFGLPERDRKDGKIPVYGSSGVVGYHAQAGVEKPSVIVGRKGNVGTIFYAESSSYPIDTAYFIDEPNKGFDLKYIYYLLNRVGLSRYGGDSAVPGLGREAVYSIDVQVPDLSAQKKIAEILGAYDAKIENNNLIVKNLEATAQAIFNEWFVKFRFPGHEKVKMVDSELGLIPGGWEIKKVSDVATLNKGVSYSSPEISDKPMGLPLINLKCFTRGGGFKLEGLKYYSGDFRKKHEVLPGQIVIALTDLTPTREVIGRPARVPVIEGFNRILISLDVCSLETKEENKEFHEFLYYTLRRREFGELMALSSSGSTVSHLSATNIESYEFLLPPSSLIQKFHKFIKETFALQGYLEIENKRLKASRDQLLKQLI